MLKQFMNKMNDKKRAAMKQQFLSMFREIAEAYDPANLPDDEAWKNDLEAIADGMFEPKPKSFDDMNEVQRYMMLSQLNAEGAAEEQMEKQGSVDVIVPETLMDVLAQGSGIVDVLGSADPSKINLHTKKEVN